MIILISDTFGNESQTEHKTIKDAAYRAYLDMMKNTASPRRIMDGDSVIWDTKKNSLERLKELTGEA